MLIQGIAQPNLFPLSRGTIVTTHKATWDRLQGLAYFKFKVLTWFQVRLQGCFCKMWESWL